MNEVKLSRSHPDVKEMLKRCYPEYRGRRITLVERDSYQMSNYWSEGSRSYVVAYDIATLKVTQPHTATSNPFEGVAHTTIEIPFGVALVEHRYIGDYQAIRVIVNGDTFTRMVTEVTSS